MFAAYKKNVAKRKAARAANNERFHNRIAEINQKRDIELALIEVERKANRERLSDKLAENNQKLREAWAK